jgi:PIN domain nuclease of toxin-antitoxin system
LTRTLFCGQFWSRKKLSKQAKALLEDSSNEVLISSASAWEIATKYRLGKLAHASSVVKNYGYALSGLAATELPIVTKEALKAGLWQVEHRDPFDRLLAAQAVEQELALVSNDEAFKLFKGLELLW